MSTFKNIMGWIWPVVVGLLIALLINTFLLSLVKVDGLSMYPNLQNNERVIMLKHAKIKRDTVVVFNAKGVDDRAGISDSTKYVKRVIGLPGDKIEYKMMVNSMLTENSNLKDISLLSNKKKELYRSQMPKIRV